MSQAWSCRFRLQSTFALVGWTWYRSALLSSLLVETCLLHQPAKQEAITTLVVDKQRFGKELEEEVHVRNRNTRFSGSIGRRWSTLPGSCVLHDTNLYSALISRRSRRALTIWLARNFYCTLRCHAICSITRTCALPLFSTTHPQLSSLQEAKHEAAFHPPQQEEHL